MRLLFALCLITIPLLAQKKHYEEINPSNGLSQGMIFDLIQDQENFIWIGTKNGLNRFDGYNYKVFLPEVGNTYSITDTQVTALYEDAQGRIWIGTASQGINLFDRRTLRFYHCSLKDVAKGKEASTIPNENISAIQSDKAGNIWVGTMAGKLFKIELPADLQQGLPDSSDFTSKVKISTIKIREKELEDQNIKMLHCAEDGTIWIGLGTELCYLKPSGKFLERIPLQPQSNLPVISVKEEADGSLIVSKADRLVKVQNQKVVQTYFFDSNATPNQEIYIDKAGGVWRRANGKIIALSTDRSIPNIPEIEVGDNCRITRVLVDREDNVWIGTNGYGIKKQLASEKRFKNYLINQSIWHLYEDSKGNVFWWDYTRIRLLDKTTGRPHSKVILPQYEGRQKGNMIEDRDGGYWCIVRKDRVEKDSVFREMILVKLDENLNTIHETELKRGVDFVYARIIQDRSGNLWIAGAEQELIRYAPTSKKITYYNYGSVLTLNRTSVTIGQLYEDKSGAIWLGTSIGLLKSEEKNGHRFFSLINLKPGAGKFLPENSVISLLDDPLRPDRYLWIGSRGGLLRLDKHTLQLKRFTEKSGLASNVVVSVTSDDQGYLWVGTYGGLSRMNLRTQVIGNYSSRDGLESDEFNGSCFLKNKKGELLFGGINGITVVKPDSTWKDREAPSVRIIGLKVNNQTIEPNDNTGLLSEAIEYTKGIELSYEQNILSFELSTSDLNSGMRNRYRYKLVGVDEGWIDGGINRFVNYARLPAGKYTLRAEATSDGSSWSATPLELNITITPPWYWNAWAISVYLLLIIFAIYLIYRAQIKRIVLQEQLGFRKKEAERLAELDQLKTRFFTNISHEFRTPLSLLIGPLSDLERKFPAERVIQKMKRNADRLLELINQMLDLGKLEAGQMKVNLAAGDVTAFLRVLAASFTSLAESRSIRFSLQQTTEQALVRFDSDKLEKIVINLLSNAFKFTPDNGQIDLLINYTSDQMTIEVSDSGIGISPDERDRIFDRFYQGEEGYGRLRAGTGIGLALVKELANMLGGDIKVRSEQGAGSSFLVTLPIDYVEGQVPKPVFSPTLKMSDTELKKSIQPEETTEIADNEDVRQNVLLIVEDNDDLRGYIAAIFRDEFTVLEAVDGEDGVAKALEHVPDVVISDLMMPKMDGLALCTALKTNDKTSHIPVVMLTARASIDDRLAGFGAEADDYLVKPFDSREIRARVKNLIAQRQKLQAKYRGVIIEQTSDELPGDSLDDLFILQAREVVERNVATNTFDIDQFAKEMNMSQQQLRRKIRALTGMSIVEFIRKFRLHFAADLLRKKAGTVSEIAFNSGFESLSYFSKRFYEEFGIVPSAYDGTEDHDKLSENED